MTRAKIIKATVEASGYTREELLSKARHKPLVYWRAAGMVVTREAGYSWNQVGSTWKRDHTTAVHAVLHMDDKAREFRVKAIRQELGCE